MLDFAPCGAHVCARLVKPDKTCGATVMYALQPPDPYREGMALDGRLDLPGEPHPYENALVQADFEHESRNGAMDIWAHDELHLEERNYAFAARLMRTGPALRRAAPSS